MAMISSRLAAIQPSATVMMTHKAAQLRAQGVDVVGFSAGEPDFDTPAHIVAAAVRAIENGLTRYTPAAGTIELKNAIAQQSEKIRKVKCNPNQVIVGVGAKHVLYNFFMAVLDEGDEVIIPAPFWVSYPDQVALAGGKAVVVQTDVHDNWILSPKELERVATTKSKVLVLNSPSNPTGSVYDHKAMVAIVEKALELGLYVICDEIYRELIYSGHQFVSALNVPHERQDRVFVVDGVSKTYAMTGWRIGWGIGNPEIVAAMTKIQGQSITNPSSISQAAAVAAITEPMDFFVDWKVQYQQRRDMIVRLLNDIEGCQCSTPAGAFYVFPNMSSIIERLGSEKTDIDLAMRLLVEAHVAVVPGTPFGISDHIRFSYATSMEQIEKGISRISQFCASL